MSAKDFFTSAFVVVATFFAVACIALGVKHAVPVTPVYADEVEELGRQIAELENLKKLSMDATAPLENEVKTLESRIANARASIVKAREEATELAATIEQRERDLEKQYEILGERIRNQYKRARQFSPLLVVAASSDATALTRDLAYRTSVREQDRHLIATIGEEITSLQTDKDKLERDQVTLAGLEKQLDSQAEFFKGEIAKAKDYQKQLASKIAVLSVRQREIISQRQASLNIPKSAGSASGGCSDDRGVDPGFSNGYAFFSFGVPNRVGLNQYGAKERAEDGQSVEQILDFYYNAELKKDYTSDVTIQVTGHGSYNLEEYLKRVYEMSESWPYETLKAQVIAARSYALAYTGNGARPICTTQACQVFKPEAKTGAWARAVDETRGWVLVNGGTPINAYYSMVHSGYVYQTSDIGWNATAWTKRGRDTRGDVSSFQDLLSQAYGKSSPWFYCGWGSRSQYNNTAWLKSEEVADIANVILLARRLSGDESDHLLQVDKPNKFGEETWDFEKVKQELRNRGGTPINSVSGVSVSADFGTGFTTGVTISGDTATESFSGSEFQQWFNLRAPANIQIIGPLFNVERH